MDIDWSHLHPSRPLLLRGRPADRSVGSPGDLPSHRYAESGCGYGSDMNTCRGRPRYSTATGTRRRLGLGGLPAFQLVSCQLPAWRRLEAGRHVDSLRPISLRNTVRRLDACAIESRQPVGTAPGGETPREAPGVPTHGLEKLFRSRFRARSRIHTVPGGLHRDCSKRLVFKRTDLAIRALASRFPGTKASRDGKHKERAKGVGAGRWLWYSVEAINIDSAQANCRFRYVSWMVSWRRADGQCQVFLPRCGGGLVGSTPGPVPRDGRVASSWA